MMNFTEVNGSDVTTTTSLVQATEVSTVAMRGNALMSAALVPSFSNVFASFAPDVSYATGSGPQSVTSLDANGDGKMDLAVANASSSTVSVLLNNGNGTYAAKVDYATGSNPSSITSLDANGDGIRDLVVANAGSNTVSVLQGKGDGTFTTKFDYATGSSPYSVTSLDANGDGKIDLAVANSSSSTVSVLLNTTPAAATTTVSLSSPTASIVEGNSGSQSLTFTVNLSAAASSAVTVNYATANGSATAGSDYNATSGTLTFAAGELSKTIAVSVLGDTTVEQNETFTVSLSNPIGTDLGTTTSTTATIVNDDNPPITPNLNIIDDFVVLQASTTAIVGAADGNDTYLLSGSMIPAGKSITISDALGVNSIQLANGLQIASAQVTTNALKINLVNGASITVLGANSFTFEAGGNTSAGIDQTDLGYSQFVQSVLGISVHTTGVVTSGAVTIGSSVSTITVSGNQTVNATAAADVFSFNAVSALADTAGTNTQATISGFSTSNDRLLIDLPVANSNLTRLDQLSGVQGVLAQTDPFTGATLINFGSDANGGQPVTLSLMGVSNPAAVQIQVV